MVTRRAWLLNFDAEIELEALGRGAMRPSRSARVTQRWTELTARVSALLGPDDLVLDEDGSGRLRGVEGRAWCPTPDASRQLERRGARLAPAPSADVLREVNHRRFCAALGGGLPGAQFVDTQREVEHMVARPSVSGPWLIKRALSFTGQGRILVEPGPLTEPARAFCRSSLRFGDGLSVEPHVRRLADFSLHGHLTAEGDLACGEIVQQDVGAAGVWLRATRAESGALAGAEEDALRQAWTETGRALAARGFFGPFGVDAFRWVDPLGTVHFHPRCEINARYSMAWALGMGPTRPDLALQSDG